MGWWYIILMNTNRVLRPVKGVENYWIFGCPWVAECVGISYSTFSGWTWQKLMDHPEKVASDLRSREQIRCFSAAVRAPPTATSPQDVVNELLRRGKI